MNPIQMIKRDHRTVRELFRRFEKADRHAERQQLGHEILEELSVHAVIEEQLIYPLLRERDPRKEDAVLNALEEHHAVKLLLAELDGLNADHERYRAKMHVVRESVEMHIEEEEGRLLPRLDAVLEREEHDDLAEAMQTMKQAAPRYPHPGAPDTPPALDIAGLIAKVTDAGKDAIRQFTSPERAAARRQVTRRARASTARKTRGSRTGRSKRSSSSRGKTAGRRSSRARGR
jgi:hemerythrin superfamily protein